MKRIDFKSKRWPGYILLYDPIPLVKIATFEEAMTKQETEKYTEAVNQNNLLSALLPCVAEWHLENFPEEVTIRTFPGTPRIESAKLIAELINAITELYRGDEDTDPNA